MIKTQWRLCQLKYHKPQARRKVYEISIGCSLTAPKTKQWVQNTQHYTMTTKEGTSGTLSSSELDLIVCSGWKIALSIAVNKLSSHDRSSPTTIITKPFCWLRLVTRDMTWHNTLGIWYRWAPDTTTHFVSTIAGFTGSFPVCDKRSFLTKRRKLCLYYVSIGPGREDNGEVKLNSIYITDNPSSIPALMDTYLLKNEGHRDSKASSFPLSPNRHWKPLD